MLIKCLGGPLDGKMHSRRGVGYNSFICAVQGRTKGFLGSTDPADVEEHEYHLMQIGGEMVWKYVGRRK